MPKQPFILIYILEWFNNDILYDIRCNEKDLLEWDLQQFFWLLQQSAFSLGHTPGKNGEIISDGECWDTVLGSNFPDMYH